MELDKHELEAVKKAIDNWEEKGMLSAGQKDELLNDLHPKRTERQQVAQYFFIIAISCAALAFGAIFIDDKILEKLKVYFELSNLFIAGINMLLAFSWLYYLGKKLNKRISNNTYEVYATAGALLLQIAVIYVCKETGYGHAYNGLLLASAISLFSLSYIMRSRVVWLGAILASTAWFVAFSTWQSNDYMFLGMNYPVRVAVFGLLVYSLSYAQRKSAKLAYTQRVTQITGLLIFLTGMWAVSVFGNYGHLDAWAKVRQVQVIPYSLVFGLITIGGLYLGVKQKDDVTRDLAVLFLLLNIYSRYFEFFWDHTNKGIFFAILAISFYIVGRWLDKRRKSEKIPQH
jgi:hypothetical protein